MTISKDYNAELFVRIPEQKGPKITLVNLATWVSSILDHAEAPLESTLQLYDRFSLRINENKAGNGPWYYYDLGWGADWYFRYSFFFNTRISGLAENKTVLGVILKECWEMGWPAAIVSWNLAPEYGYESHLPMQGGNDLDQVFWREDHLAFRKKAGLESYLGPPIND